MFSLRNNVVVSFVLLLFIVSCQKQERSRTLYNIDSLLSYQSSYLADQKARLDKQAALGVTNDHLTFVPKDSAEWSKELTVFRQIDQINKPVNQGQYLIDDGLMDPFSNLTVKAISAKEDLPVRYLRIFYQESLQKPRRIEAMYRDANSLYGSARLLTMEFRQLNNKSILTSYSINGGQKMMFSDTVQFTIKGKVIFE